jgi:hypothetical protein
MIDLASHIIERKQAPFNPSQFNDWYEESMVELIKSKQAGVPLQSAPAPRPANVINLMEALRRSIAEDTRTGKAKARCAGGFERERSSSATSSRSTPAYRSEKGYAETGRRPRRSSSNWRTLSRRRTQVIYSRRAHRLVGSSDSSRTRKQVFRLGGRKGLCGDATLDAAATGGDKRDHRRSFRVRHL